jgi:hypothetical protein
MALLNVVRNNGIPGVDGCSVDEVLGSDRSRLPRPQRALLNGRYQPGDIRRVWIPKPSGGERGLGIPNVIDRWVQQAVLQVLEPIFEPTFHSSSHGFRPKRGAHTAIAEAKEYVGDGYGVVVDIDLSKFFDRVHPPATPEPSGAEGRGFPDPEADRPDTEGESRAAGWHAGVHRRGHSPGRSPVSAALQRRARRVPQAVGEAGALLCLLRRQLQHLRVKRAGRSAGDGLDPAVPPGPPAAPGERGEEQGRPA